MFAWLSLLPWRWIGGVLLLAGALWGVREWDHSRMEAQFSAGAQSRQHEVDQERGRADYVTVQLDQERQARKAEHVAQEKADEIAKNTQAELARTASALADARADLRLRDAIRSAAEPAPAGPVPEGPGSAGSVDGRAAALGDVSESCRVLAGELAGEAEGLATQVRGLQAFLKQAKASLQIPPPEIPTQELEHGQVLPP